MPSREIHPERAFLALSTMTLITSTSTCSGHPCLAFEAWLEAEKKRFSIEFTIHQTIQEGHKSYPKNHQYVKKVHDVCSWGYSGGKSSYVKRTSHTQAVSPNVRDSCHDPFTATVHGRPTSAHRPFFRSVIECTATDHVISHACIYTRFSQGLIP